eukprot:scaffold131137_cov31-Tisochrysis_lutea.AAC.1
MKLVPKSTSFCESDARSTGASTMSSLRRSGSAASVSLNSHADEPISVEYGSPRYSWKPCARGSMWVCWPRPPTAEAPNVVPFQFPPAPPHRMGSLPVSIAPLEGEQIDEAA